MRLIHTSDWHLGRSFHQVGLLGAQASYLDHLVDVVRREKVDAVLVSGDVYDRAMPAPDTVALLSQALQRLVDAGAQVIISSGNHDSAARLGFGAGLLERTGVHLRTSLADVARPVLLAGAAVYPLPYLEPSLAADALGATERTHAGVLRAAMDAVRADAAARPGVPVVAMAHAFVSGGVGSESERDISVGGVSAVPPTVFAGAHYAALGHLHGAQQVAPGVRYSGSPVAMSFSEVNHRKVSLLVDLDGRSVSGESGEAPVERPLAVPLRPYAARAASRSDLDVCCDFLEHVRGGRAASEQERELLAQAVEESRLARRARDDEGVAGPAADAARTVGAA